MTDYIPEPLVILLGSRPWPLKPGPDGDCPACGKGIKEGDDITYCAVCDSLSPRREAQIRAAHAKAGTRERTKGAEEKARKQLGEVAKAQPQLSERHRRWIWNGCMGSIVRERPEVTNEARLGRDFLRSIGQEPNWNLILDRHGKVVGRYDEDLVA
jgi:uncharacterized Zn finger protein (UPF0148 family)